MAPMTESSKSPAKAAVKKPRASKKPRDMVRSRRQQLELEQLSILPSLTLVHAL
jgi:hypothetical protein